MAVGSGNGGIGGLLVGATYPLRAIGLLLQHRSLLKYVLIPIGLNLGIAIVVYSLLLTSGLHWVDQWIASLPELASELGQWHPPAVDWPSLPWPQWAWPSWLTLPPIAWPSWLRLPQVSLPQVSLPQVSLPLIALPGWLVDAPIEVASFLLRIVLILVLLLVTGFVFLQFGFILGAPFYGKLSESIEQIRTGDVEIVAVSPWREVGRAILYEAKKLVLLVTVGVGLLVLQFLPGVGAVILAVGSVTIGACLTCLDFFDATMERRRLRFRQKLRVVRRSLPASAGFALVCFGLVNIPLINLVGIPLCVAAGSLFCCDRVLPGLEAD